MCYLCVDQHTPIGGWTEPDRPPSYRYCNCLVNTHGYKHRRVPSVGWLMVPYLRRHLTHGSTGTIHYGLLGIILEWCALPPYTIHRVPGRVRIVYRNGRRFHIQGCCIQIYAPFRTQPKYVRRSIRGGARHRWMIPWTHHLRRLHYLETVLNYLVRINAPI